MSNLPLDELCKLIRYDILTSTTKAGSGHPTSSLSAVEFMSTLFFGGFLKYNLDDPQSILNDRVIFSKGHASPLLYSLYHAAGAIDYDKLITLRTFDSELEGHPTPRFKFVDVATGSLGQGLSVGVGMALGMRSKGVHAKVWVLLGDSEMAEGQIWEALQLASHYKLNNLVGILDVNRLGQQGETMVGWNLKTYENRIQSFGWKTISIEDGNDLSQVQKAFEEVITQHTEPTMIIAKTVKGKGVSFLENKDGWHGKTLSPDDLKKALKELGEVNLDLKGTITQPQNTKETQSELSQINKRLEDLATGSTKQPHKIAHPSYKMTDLVATREAFGEALVAMGKQNENIVAFDAEVGNSTFENTFQKAFPSRYFEMFIAEQNMISTALGISKLGYIPFMSTFAAFLTRGFDQLRMAQYSQPNLKIVGSHCGISIGQDGPSQMGLEDISMIRSISNSIVFYPSDAVSTFKLVEQMIKNDGLFYLRTTRSKTPVLYNNDELFEIGGSKTVYQSDTDKAVVFAAGITLHEAIKAYKQLKKEGIDIAVVDLYSIKPLDEKTIKEMAQKTGHVIVVEDHYPAGGIGEAVLSVIVPSSEPKGQSFTQLAVDKLPHSGTPEELMAYEQINADAIVKAVQSIK